MCKDCGCSLPGDNPPGISGPGHKHEEDGHDHDHGPGHHHGDDHSHPHSHPHSHGHHHHGGDHDHPHPHDHDDHGHDHEHHPEPTGRRTLEVRHSILEKNDRLAERNRGFFRSRGMLVLNVLSSPGSGKTTLLSQTLRSLAKSLRVGVIVGDLATDNDADRLRESGAPVVQVTTGTVCHLEAEMVARAAARLDLNALDLLIIENVGNLVCPAAYDLGEDLRVVLLSVTEGEDKPLKYPPMFQAADVVLVSKTDLAEACGFNRELAIQNIKQMAPKAEVFELSAKTGQGMDAWLNFLARRHGDIRQRSPLDPD